ncbi:MG2 domain-containing protein [Candidatus Tisiphia endosymbiont of Beris chalybata]|uniref:MG2 domain-containing protein n=1 Tax=Candidatus Tisiphia endosymbiont of Beris chalybata TaxID=3066262 RepID=UPI00312C76FB
MLIALIRTIIVPGLWNLVAFKHAKAPCIRKGFDTVKSIIIFALLTILMPSIALSASTTPAGNNKPTNILEITPPITPRLEKYYLGQLFGKNKLYISLCDATITERCAKPRIIAENGGRIAKGITISPYIGGEWRINENYHIEFIPATYWLAKTNYTITIDKNSLPIFSSLNYNIISFQTQPLAPNIKEMGYIQDEYDLEKKFVQAKIEWNYPVEQKSFEERLKLSVENTQSLLPLSITLNDKKTEATVTTTLTALTDKERVASLVISEGVKPLYGGKALSHSDIEEMDRTYMVGKENFHKHHEQTLIPDIYSYFKVKNVDFTIVKNEKNIPEQIIVINTNVPISPEELKNNLQLLLLPKDKAGSFMGAPSQKDYQWKSSAEITKEVFDQSMLVNFDSLPTYTKYSSTNSIKVNMPPGRFLMLTLKRGTKSYGDLILGQDYQKIIRVNNFLSEIKIMSEGSLLSLFGEKKLSIYSLGVSTLNIEINQIAKHNINHLISQTYQDSKFHQPNFRNWSFNEYNISKVFEEVRELNSEVKNIPQYSTLDFNQYLKSKSFAPAGNEENKGLFFVKISDLNSNVQDKRLILITDIGFLVKIQQDGMQEIFVSSITKQAPLKGALVEIIGLNGQAIATATTDSSGHASLPNVRNYMHEKSPVAYIIKHKNDLAFMPYGRRDREVNYSKFDVSGITASAEGLKAYLFSDRGIYKPGEQGNIGIIVKQANFANNLENMPLELEVTNPRGQIFDKKKITLNKEGLVDYLFQTNDSSPTGTYNFALYIAKDRYRGSMLGNVAVKVEEFLPDRMKIQSRFKVPSKKLYVSPDNLTVEVDLLNLYGSPAVGRTVEATINLVQTGFTNLGLPDYKDYIFYSGMVDERHFTEKLNTSITDNNGHTEFDLNLKQYSNATYRVDFLAEGFEPDSGRSVKTTNTILVSPLPYIIGFKPSSNLAYLKRHDECNLEFIALDNEGNKISIPQLEVELKRINHVNSLTYQADGSYAYQSLPIETSITKSVIAANTGLSYLYKLSTQEVGDYAIYLRDKQDPDKLGRVFSHIEFTVIGEGNVSASLTKNSSLKIKTNKADYKAGEEIEVSVTAPYIGYGLITIETDKVHNFTWFKAHTSNSTHKITVPKDFEGKGYINVQFIRSLASSDIFISPFSYATIPFTANIEKREQKIIIDVPKKIQPGHDLTY